MTQDFIPTVTEAQQKLHADMRRDTDMRWHLLPVESVKPSIPGWVWVVAVCLSLGAIYVIAFGV